MFVAKFKVDYVKDHGNNNVEVSMKPVMGDNDFTKYTPSGQLTFISTNPNVNAQLAPQKVFEVTFNEVE